MKTFVTLAALLSNTEAFLKHCKSSDECTDPVYDGGCCHLFEIVSESDNANYGLFEDNVFNGTMKQGEWAALCLTESHVRAREEEIRKQGYLSNYDDLRIFLEQNPGAD